METKDRTEPRTIPVPDAEQRKRAAIRDTVTRGARGNVQLAHGKFVTPKDKSLGDAGH